MRELNVTQFDVDADEDNEDDDDSEEPNIFNAAAGVVLYIDDVTLASACRSVNIRWRRVIMRSASLINGVTTPPPPPPPPPPDSRLFAPEAVLAADASADAEVDPFGFEWVMDGPTVEPKSCKKVTNNFNDVKDGRKGGDDDDVDDDDGDGTCAPFVSSSCSSSSGSIPTILRNS